MARCCLQRYSSMPFLLKRSAPTMFCDTRRRRLNVTEALPWPTSRRVNTGYWGARRKRVTMPYRVRWRGIRQNELRFVKRQKPPASQLSCKLVSVSATIHCAMQEKGKSKKVKVNCSTAGKENG